MAVDCPVAPFPRPVAFAHGAPLERHRGDDPAVREREARSGDLGRAEGERLRRARLDEHQRAREFPREAVVAAPQVFFKGCTRVLLHAHPEAQRQVLEINVPAAVSLGRVGRAPIPGVHDDAHDLPVGIL